MNGPFSFACGSLFSYLSSACWYKAPAQLGQHLAWSKLIPRGKTPFFVGASTRTCGPSTVREQLNIEKEAGHGMRVSGPAPQRRRRGFDVADAASAHGFGASNPPLSAFPPGLRADNESATVQLFGAPFSMQPARRSRSSVATRP